MYGCLPYGPVIITIIIAVISIVLYATDMGQNTAPYEIDKNVHVKTSKIIILWSYVHCTPHAHMHSHTTCTHAFTHHMHT